MYTQAFGLGIFLLLQIFALIVFHIITFVFYMNIFIFKVILLFNVTIFSLNFQLLIPPVNFIFSLIYSLITLFFHSFTLKEVVKE